MSIVFTATCKRDAARFDICARTQERYLGWKHVALATEEVGPRVSRTALWEHMTMGAVPPYVGQQLTKLYSNVIAPTSELMFHVDSDMWFDETSKATLAEYERVWVYNDDPALLRPWTIQRNWAETSSFLLKHEVKPRSFMMSTRGWWIDPEVLIALRARVYKMHGNHLQYLVAKLDPARFSEYQLYAAFAWEFAREAHRWVDNRELPMSHRDVVGRDMALFVPHWTSADAPTPEIEARWEELLRENT